MKIPFRTSFLTLAIAGLTAGCADAPTAPARASSADPSYTHGYYVTISGPSVIYSSGSYTFYASTHALVSPTFQWSVRTCPSANVGTCTSPWTIWPSTSADYFTTQLSPDCSGDGQKVFQISVVAKGWYSPQVTDTHVTALCENIN